MIFRDAEEIESWFANNKYDKEVHSAIDFLITEIKSKNTKNKQCKKTYRPKTKPLRTGY